MVKSKKSKLSCKCTILVYNVCFLKQVCQQNKMLKARLAKIHNDSALADLQLTSPPGSPVERRVRYLLFCDIMQSSR